MAVSAPFPLCQGAPAGLKIPESSKAVPRWYALRTKPRSEEAVAELLRIHAVTSYMPSCWERRRTCDGWREIKRPLFPGYVMCYTALDIPFRIVSVPGVLGFVSFGRRPAEILEDEIAAIRRLVASGRRLSTMGVYRQGQRVRICSGALSGLEGRIVRVKNERMLLVTVDFLRRSVRVSLEGDCVEDAE